MKLKILTIIIIIIIPIITSFTNAEKISKNDINEIRIAVYSMGDIYLASTQRYFDIFKDYQWKIGYKIYKFNVTTIEDKDIFKGELNIKNYDVFTMGWMEATQMTMRLSRPGIKNSIWKNKITNFIREGGGYFGSCAGAIIMTSGLSNQPQTSYEKMIDKGSLHISQAKSYIQSDFVFLAQLSGQPERIGSTAYVWFSGWDINNKSHFFGGCCMDVVVNKSNPIFSDLHENTQRIHWSGGSAFIIPEQSNDIKVIAYYPEEDISDNKSTQIHAWKYTGRLLGFLNGFIKSINLSKTIFDTFYFSPFQATDWEMTDKIILIDRANRPFMTMETYPNDNQGRIILCGGHPEAKVWWGGYIEEEKDTDKNNLFDSLHHWTGIDKIIDEYTWWIYRREGAWTGKVPDTDLPPVYGPSQVCNIYPFIQTSNFTIYGNVEISNGNESLDLYFRHSPDNFTWDNWMFYEKDIDSSDGWSWEFNAQNGSGYYQFYSIRNVVYENYTETETIPPGPDASVYIISNY